MLRNHPDKNSDPNSARIAQRLNDAKDKAVTVARQNKKIADHLEELKGYTRQELMSNTTYSQLIFSKVMSMQRDLGIGGHRLMDIFIGGYYRLVNHLKECISTLEDSVAEEKAKAKQIEEEKTSKINTLISSLNSLQEKLEVERRNNEMISEANIELTREKDNTALEIEMLKRERDDAISKASMLKRERDNAISKVNEVTIERDAALDRATELASERDDARSERDEAVRKAKAEKELAIIPMVDRVEEGEAANEDCQESRESGKEPNTQSNKKRKHEKVFAEEQEHCFKQDLRNFIHSQLTISHKEASEEFTSTTEIKKAFDRLQSSRGKQVVSNDLFSKNFKEELEPHYTRFRCKWGYKGVVLKDD